MPDVYSDRSMIPAIINFWNYLQFCRDSVQKEIKSRSSSGSHMYTKYVTTLLVYSLIMITAISIEIET